jgi:hypothetical protein
MCQEGGVGVVYFKGQWVGLSGCCLHLNSVPLTVTGPKLKIKFNGCGASYTWHGWMFSGDAFSVLRELRAFWFWGIRNSAGPDEKYQSFFDVLALIRLWSLPSI